MVILILYKCMISFYLCIYRLVFKIPRMEVGGKAFGLVTHPKRMLKPMKFVNISQTIQRKKPAAVIGCMCLSSLLWQKLNPRKNTLRGFLLQFSIRNVQSVQRSVRLLIF